MTTRLKNNLREPAPSRFGGSGELRDYYITPSQDFTRYTKDYEEKHWNKETEFDWTPGGVFCNLEHVASPSKGLHHRFLDALGITPEDEDKGNVLLDVETQLTWLREVGFDDVDCYWKWLELCLFGGLKPSIDG